MALNDVYRIVSNYTCQGEPCTMVNHWTEITASTAVPQVTASFLGEEWESRFDAFATAELSEDVTLLNTSTNRIWPSLGPMATLYFDPGTTGGVSQDAVPELAAAVVSFYTVIAGKSGRGRCYIAGVPENDVDAGVFFDSPASSFQSAVDTMYANIDNTGIGNGEFQLSVWSRKNSEATPVDFKLLRNALGTQRRRRPRNPGAIQDPV